MLHAFKQTWFSNIRGDVLAGIAVALALIPEAFRFQSLRGSIPDHEDHEDHEGREVGHVGPPDSGRSGFTGRRPLSQKLTTHAYRGMAVR